MTVATLARIERCSSRPRARGTGWPSKAAGELAAFGGHPVQGAGVELGLVDVRRVRNPLCPATAGGGLGQIMPCTGELRRRSSRAVARPRPWEDGPVQEGLL